MAWLLLLIAGLLEVGWAVGLKYTEGFSRLVPSVLTLFCLAASIGMLASSAWITTGLVGTSMICAARTTAATAHAVAPVTSQVVTSATR